MPWRRPERPKPPPSPHAVPDPESVRRAALAASWQRDRRIAQRRLAWRWVLWFVGRYFLHILGLVVLLLLAGWLLRSQSGSANAEHAAIPIAMSEASPLVPAVLQTLQAAPAWPTPSRIPEPAYTELPAQELNAVDLRLLRQLAEKPEPAPLQNKTPRSASQAESLIPTLKPENWLHSKEP